MPNPAKHQNYEILNLLGYGLAKFDNNFIKEFGFETKSSFFEYFVQLNIVETGSVVKNRMDLFDPFFDNGRKGWWQKGDAYIHRKQLIDSLFGYEDVKGFSNIVKLFLQEKYQINDFVAKVKPITQSRFRKLQETGLEAELYFMNNYKNISGFENGELFDARLYGDGYDFELDVNPQNFLIEVKGVREKKGNIRLTQKEYQKAKEYTKDYILTIILNLNDTPKIVTVDNPVNCLAFEEVIRKTEEIKEYHLVSKIC